MQYKSIENVFKPTIQICQILNIHKEMPHKNIVYSFIFCGNLNKTKLTQTYQTLAMFDRIPNKLVGLIQN